MVDLEDVQSKISSGEILIFIGDDLLDRLRKALANVEDENEL
jgi:hypothetical protein